MWDLGEVRELAARMHGLVDRAGVLDLGGSDDLIQRQLGHRRWTEIHPGVYYLNVTPIIWKGRVLAAVLAGGSNTLASHRTAALLWELDGLSGLVIEITSPYNGRPEPNGVLVHRSRRRLPFDAVDSIPVTTVERTLLDLAANLPDTVLEKALMCALHRRLTTFQEMEETLRTDGDRGVRGTRRMRRVLARAYDGITGSPAEVEMASIIRESGVLAPVGQHKIALPDGSHAHADFAWVEVRKLVEVDGYAAHSSPDRLHDDLVRQNQLMELGWQIRRFSARQVLQEPRVVRSELIRFLEAS